MASYDEAAVVFKQFDYDASGYVDEVEMFSALSDFGLSGEPCMRGEKAACRRCRMILNFT